MAGPGSGGEPAADEAAGSAPTARPGPSTPTAAATHRDRRAARRPRRAGAAALEPLALRHRLPAGGRRAPRLVVRRTDHPGQLGADPGRGLAVPRLRAQPGRRVADAPRHPALGRGRSLVALGFVAALALFVLAIAPGGGRPGLHAHQERPRLLRPAPAQPPDPAARRRSTTSSTRPRTTSPSGDLDPAGLRRRARRRARDPGLPRPTRSS